MFNTNKTNDISNNNPREYDAIVVDNKYQENGNYVTFYIPELTPFLKGQLLNNPLPMKRKIGHAYVKGLTKTYKGTHNNNLLGIWMSKDGYRKTPPDVQRGEKIKVWRLGKTNIWYWDEVNTDAQTKRRSETIVQSIIADKPDKEDLGKADSTNTYYTEMSSHNKTWTVSTSKANGEFAAYIIQINADKGAVIIKDDLGNLIELNSAQNKIWMRNSTQTEVSLINENIEVKCNNDQSHTIGNNLNINVQGNVNINVQGNTQIDVGGNANVNVKGSTTLDCPNTSITGNVDIGKNLNVKGNVAIMGSLGVKGGTSLGGGGKVSGAMSVSGTISSPSGVSFPNGGNLVAGYRRG